MPWSNRECVATGTLGCVAAAAVVAAAAAAAAAATVSQRFEGDRRQPQGAKTRQDLN
jgi:hypothetical protein